MSTLNICYRASSKFHKLGIGILPKFSSGKTFKSSYKTKMLKVTVVGAAGRVGKPLCLMLKQCPCIDELAVYDVVDTCGFALELAHVDTRCKITSYTGIEHLKQALEDSKIVVVVAASPKTSFLSYSAMFDPNALIIRDIIENFSIYCPKALLAIATNPVNSIVPLASEILKSNVVYNPKTIFGVTSVDVVRANTFVAEVQGLEPECVFVPVIGGHADKTIIPVLSQAKPCADFTNEELEKITNKVQNAHYDILKAKVKQSTTLSCAFAITRFVISLIKGIRRRCDIIEYAYVKSECLPNAKYLATPLRLGPGGIQKNFGIPYLTEYEKCQLENAIPLIMEDVKKGELFAKGVNSTASHDPELPPISCPN